MEESKKVRVVFEFDRKDYDNVLFLLGAADQEIDEVEKIWEAMTSEDLILKRDSFASLGVAPQKMLAMFVTGAVVSVEDNVKSQQYDRK